MKPAASELDNLLRGVSRSFYLTLHVLPHSVRQQLSCAYLLARAGDIIADTLQVEVDIRRAALLDLRRCIQDACNGRPIELPDFGKLARAQTDCAGGSSAERLLLKNVGRILDALSNFSPEDRRAIRAVLENITRGQESDLTSFGPSCGQEITALGSDEDLNRYIYCVAGCVGEFWTRMCRAHVFPKAALDDAYLLERSVRFGKGLQLVNILRDLPADLRQGRCYIPQSRLSEYNLRPNDLLDPTTIGRFRPLYQIYLHQAADHLAAGWQYTITLPFRYLRLRLACAWPILIGMKTLERLSKINILDYPQHTKLSRSEVRRLIFRSLILYPFPSAWNRLAQVHIKTEQSPAHGCR